MKVWQRRFCSVGNSSHMLAPDLWSPCLDSVVIHSLDFAIRHVNGLEDGAVATTVEDEAFFADLVLDFLPSALRHFEVLLVTANAFADGSRGVLPAEVMAEYRTTDVEKVGAQSGASACTSGC